MPRKRTYRSWWAAAGVLCAVCAFSALLAWPVRAADRSNEPQGLDRAVAISAARPDYPYEARRAGLTGAGVVVIELDSATGKVTSVRMDPSTGHAILDRAAIDAFMRWRFKPGTVSPVRTPIRFTVSGPPVYTLDVKAKPADEVLAGFLGKGTVQRGNFPAYPRSVTWTSKQGSGVYELHVQKDGSVAQVKILKSSGDGVFDAATVKTLRKWRLRRGPLIIELPLAFRLTPTSYSVDIPKRQ